MADKKEYITLELDPAFKAAIDKAAADEMRSTSNYCRFVLAKAIGFTNREESEVAVPNQ